MRNMKVLKGVLLSAVAALAVVSTKHTMTTGTLTAHVAQADPEQACGFGPSGLAGLFRMNEAVRVTTELNSKVMNALDKVMDLNPNDPNQVDSFDNHLGFVLNLQYDQSQMSIRIDNFILTNAAGFRDGWLNATNAFFYRKRNIANYNMMY